MPYPKRRAFLLDGGFRPAYDPFAASIVHAYEPARRVLSSYTGPLRRLRRASDNAEAAFGYLANGDLDTAAIAAWAGGASYDVTVYDQKGGDNVTQATAAKQPLYVANARNGHAGMTFDGANDWLGGAYTTGGALSQPFNIFAVAQLDATAVDDGLQRQISDGDDVTNRAALYQSPAVGADNWAIYGGGAPLIFGTSDSIWSIWAVLFNGASSQVWRNGTSMASGNAGALNPDGLAIGAQYDGLATWWKGPIVSLIIVDPSLTDAERVTMQAAMNSYWGVF